MKEGQIGVIVLVLSLFIGGYIAGLFMGYDIGNSRGYNACLLNHVVKETKK